MLVLPLPRMLMLRSPRLLLLLALLLVACSGGGNGSGSGPGPGPWDSGVVLPHVEQQPGDPERGRHELLHGSFMSCGIPYKLYANPVIGPLIRPAFGPASVGEPFPGREGKNADLPYALNAFTAVDKAQPGYRQTNFYLAKVNEKIGRKTEADKRMRMYEAQKARGEVADGQ